MTKPTPAAQATPTPEPPDDTILRDALLKKLENGVEFDHARSKLMLVGRSTKVFKRVTRFLSWVEGQHPNRGDWKDPDTGRPSYPNAPPRLGRRP